MSTLQLIKIAIKAIPISAIIGIILALTFRKANNLIGTKLSNDSVELKKTAIAFGWATSGIYLITKIGIYVLNNI